jgi:hypothetical protein
MFVHGLESSSLEFDAVYEQAHDQSFSSEGWTCEAMVLQLSKIIRVLGTSTEVPTSVLRYRSAPKQKSNYKVIFESFTTFHAIAQE